jgi:hypothetical protein
MNFYNQIWFIMIQVEVGVGDSFTAGLRGYREISRRW